MRISPSAKDSFPRKPAPAGAPELPREGRVLTEFEKRFEQWDRNGNGQISWSEMRQNLADEDIKGKDAVALATLYGLLEQDSAYRGLERKAPVRFERLLDLYYDYTDGDDRPMADTLYQKFSGKLQASNEELFPHGLPNGHMGKQGTAPSCGFLAATFAQVLSDPHRIKESVTELEDGSYQVRFPGVEKPISVPPLTDTERALFATAESNGSWLTVLEKAWGLHQKKSNPLAAFEQTTYPEDAIGAWSNGSATTTRVPKNPKGYKKGELPEFLRTAHRELAANHIVVTWTRYDDLTEESLVPGHAYTMTGIDPKNGTVTLRNPWGRLEPSDENGRPLDGRDDGLFDFPLEQFSTNFEKIARQKA